MTYSNDLNPAARPTGATSGATTGAASGAAGSAGAATDSALPARQQLDAAIEEHLRRRLPALRRLWRYYRNAARPTGRPQSAQPKYELAQAEGLPRRLALPRDVDASDAPDREQVIENDIAWRIHTLVDFMFPKPVMLRSLAEDVDQARQIEQFLAAVLEANGGVAFFADLALLGAVYGTADVLVRPLEPAAAPRSAENPGGDPLAAAERFRLELIEAPRAIPFINSDDYRKLDAYAIHVRSQADPAQDAPLLARLRQRVFGDGPTRRHGLIERTEVFSATQRASYLARRTATGWKRLLLDTAANPLGRIPIVHIQNLPQPFVYEGLSEVEPLIPLQDELNTRLSDRANRVTFQSFKMYLGKGIEQFIDRPVGPGQMWATDNPDACIEEFGGDGDNPSEAAHIEEIRQALDKTSGVTPVAAGLIRDKVGNLTSENALRIVLMGLLARTQKKRVTYGAGIERLCELILHAADVAGVLHTEPAERRVRIDWPNPLPQNESQLLANARAKLDIGVPRRQVLAELGYDSEM